jgi:hypothetical protein
MPNLLAISYIIAIILGLIALIDLWKLGVLATANIPIVIGAIIVLFTLRCMGTIFDKAGRLSWAVIIPVYNCVVLCQIAGYSGRFAWLFLVPIVNVIAFLRVCMGLAEHFGRSTRFGLSLFLFFPIVLPILAFSKKIQHEYDVKTSAPIQVALPSVRESLERKVAWENFVRAGEFEKDGESEKAIELYTETISLDPRHTEAYFKRGMLLMDSGSKAAALADFQRVIEIADNPELADLAKGNIAKLA